MVKKNLYGFARKLYIKKDYSKALSYLKKASKSQPRDMNVLFAMANCFEKLGDQGSTIKTIKRIVAIDNRNDSVYFSISYLYAHLGMVENTIEACERAIELNPRKLDYYLRIANLYEKSNQHSKALEILGQAIDRFPDNVALQIAAAKSERRLGKTRESCERLQNLSMQETIMPTNLKTEYHFELGFVQDSNGSAEQAFHHFTKANALVRSQPAYQRVDKNHSINLISNLAQLDFVKINEIIDVSRKNPPPVQPVFFVGFPRSGTTLLQKALDSHPGIHVIEEDNPLGHVTSLVEQEPEKYLESAFLLNEKNIDKLRKLYFSEARKYVPVSDASLIVDKLPMNIVQIHIIKILFPDAKILLGLRHPCDSILSCFMQHFAVNRAMASMYEFETTINYYDKTMSLWQIFKNELDFESLAVRYEDLIENLEGELRRVLLFLDIPWDEEVLNYRQDIFKRGFINTPSYGQVVKPIYKEARYRWHRYQKHFEPHDEILKHHCDAFGYLFEVGIHEDMKQ
jgi:tetratricopeptide (TPR) repeat protein